MRGGGVAKGAEKAKKAAKVSKQGKVAESAGKVAEVSKVEARASTLGDAGKRAKQLLKVKGTYLNKPENVGKLARDLRELNMILEPKFGGRIISGSVESALHSATYYENVLEQSSAVFQGIIKNHTFEQANKRTATEAFKKILHNNGLPCTITQEKFIEIGLKIENNTLVEVKEIAEAFLEATSL